MFIFDLFHDLFELENFDLADLVVEIDFQVIGWAKLLPSRRLDGLFESFYEHLPIEPLFTAYLVDDSLKI